MFILITALTFGLLLFSTFLGIPLWYALLASMGGYSLLTRKKGFSWSEIAKMLGAGAKKALIVLQIFVFIGVLTASWMLSGTTPYLIYLGTSLINPAYFYVISFVLCCVISYLLGTAFGSVSTIGVVLVAIATSAGLNIPIVTGAIISGIYFGDRASPLSSSLALVSAVSGAEHGGTVKMALSTGVVPFLLTSGLFLLLSPGGGVNAQISTELPSQIASAFGLNPITLLPVAVILILCMLKINAKIAMLSSSVVALLLAIFLQKAHILHILYSLVMGFFMDEGSPLYAIIKGGGLLSMLSAAIIILISCGISELINGGSLIPKTNREPRVYTRSALFLKTFITACVTAAIGCNQSISIIMTSSLQKAGYEENSLSGDDLARDVSITSSLVTVLFPWNIAVFIPIAMLGLSGTAYIPYLFYIYIMQIYHFLSYAVREKKYKSTCQSV